MGKRSENTGRAPDHRVGDPDHRVGEPDVCCVGLSLEVPAEGPPRDWVD